MIIAIGVENAAEGRRSYAFLLYVIGMVLQGTDYLIFALKPQGRKNRQGRPTAFSTKQFFSSISFFFLRILKKYIFSKHLRPHTRHSYKKYVYFNLCKFCKIRKILERSTSILNRKKKEKYAEHTIVFWLFLIQAML